MSTNRKNNQDKAVLRNLVEPLYVNRRKLLTFEEKPMDSLRFSGIVDSINEAIQNINISLESRNVPYYQIEQTKEAFDVDKTRVIMRSERSNCFDKTNVSNSYKQSKENSFLVELFLHDNGYVEIGCEEENGLEPVGVSGFVLLDREYLSCALEDIFLDSALFNSYSFLRDLPSEEKRKINQIKVSYLREQYGTFTDIISPFYQFNSTDYEYLSMAFFVRKSDREVDLDRLIGLWDGFVKAYYPGFIHVEPPVAEQLKALVDIAQYSNTIKDDCDKLGKGSYWLLRIHKEPVNKDIEKWLKVEFGKPKIGREKIIPFSCFPKVQELVRNRHITAFKIVIT